MKTNNPIRSLLVATILFGVTSVFGHDPKGHADPMVTALQPLTGAEFEMTFLQQMIQHHRSGVDMAKLVSDHTQRPELRQFADKMISMQQEEIAKMTGWLKDWHNTSPRDPANAKSQEKMKAEMVALETKRDSDFDKSFIDMMSRHHDSAIEMAKQAEEKATHAELKKFAAKLANDQQEEMEQLKSWGKSWFGPV